MRFFGPPCNLISRRISQYRPIVVDCVCVLNFIDIAGKQQRCSYGIRVLGCSNWRRKNWKWWDQWAGSASLLASAWSLLPFQVAYVAVSYSNDWNLLIYFHFLYVIINSILHRKTQLDRRTLLKQNVPRYCYRKLSVRLPVCLSRWWFVVI